MCRIEHAVLLELRPQRTDARMHTFCAESLSSSTTVYNRNGGLKSYVLLHDSTGTAQAQPRLACYSALGTLTGA